MTCNEEGKEIEGPGCSFGKVVELSDGLNSRMTLLRGRRAETFDLLFIAFTGRLRQKGNFTLWQAGEGRVPVRGWE